MHGLPRNDLVVSIGLEAIVLLFFLEILPCGMGKSKFEERVLSGDLLFQVPYLLSRNKNLYANIFLGKSHCNTSYAKCRMGLRERKMEMAGNGFSSRPIFVS